jgi:hypothetical protein
MGRDTALDPSLWCARKPPPLNTGRTAWRGSCAAVAKHRRRRHSSGGLDLLLAGKTRHRAGLLRRGASPPWSARRPHPAPAALRCGGQPSLPVWRPPVAQVTLRRRIGLVASASERKEMRRATNRLGRRTASTVVSRKHVRQRMGEISIVPSWAWPPL